MIGFFSKTTNVDGVSRVGAGDLAFLRLVLHSVLVLVRFYSDLRGCTVAHICQSVYVAE